MLSGPAGTYTRYLCELVTTEGTSTHLLRYSELRKLHQTVKKMFPDDTFPFPAKQFLGIGDNFGSEFLKAKDSFDNVIFFERTSDVVDYLKKNKLTNKSILLKGSRKLKLEQLLELL